MNKSDLIDAIAASANLTKAASKKVLDIVIKSTSTALKEGDSVSLKGFGSFSVTERAARKVRNIQNGEIINIKAKPAIKFTPAEALKKDIEAKIKIIKGDGGPPAHTTPYKP